MSKKSKSFDEAVRSQHDAIQWADDTGQALVKPETAKYFSVATGKGSCHLNDNCRTMPKQERDLVKFWFFCLGLPVSVLVITFPFWFPIASKLFTG